MFEIDFSNDFHIDIDDENVRYFVVKKLKFIHKNDWFKKFIFVCVVIYVVVVIVDINFSITSVTSLFVIILSQTSMFIVANISISLIEIVLFNDIIVYNFDELNSFVKIVENFSTF